MTAVVWIVVQPRRRHPSVEAVHDGGRTPGIVARYGGCLTWCIWILGASRGAVEGGCDARAGEVALVPAERAVGNTAWEVRWPWAAPTAVGYLEQRSLTAGAPVGFYENQEGRQGQKPLCLCKEVAKDKIPPAASPTPLIRPGPRPATETAFHDGPRRTDTPASLPKNSPSVAWVVMQVVTTSKQRSRHSHRKDTKAI
ncbi:hypothetical protein MCOR18_008921 [Pyricularia oryzae]|nr:hypothetical protein MCOR18_008921 [Pyricularia oryzae]KAI6563989.1 hypothetical protein MCOR09_007279 [Pyricularia oryzae]